MKISVIISTFNSSKTIAPVISSILAQSLKPYEIIVIDDGSNDKIKNKIDHLKLKYRNIVFAQNKINMGMGFSIKKGIGLSKYNHVVIFDSDFSYNIELLDKFYKNSLPLAPFIYAKRKISQDLFQNTKISRLVAGYFFNAILRIFLKIHSRDTQAGFKFIDKSIFTNCSDFISEDYMYDVELFILARKLGITPHPVEVVNINSVENSNIKLINDSLKMFVSIYKLRKLYFVRDINK